MYVVACGICALHTWHEQSRVASMRNKSRLKMGLSILSSLPFFYPIQHPSTVTASHSSCKLPHSERATTFHCVPCRHAGYVACIVEPVCLRGSGRRINIRVRRLMQDAGVKKIQRPESKQGPSRPHKNKATKQKQKVGNWTSAARGRNEDIYWQKAKKVQFRTGLSGALVSISNPTPFAEYLHTKHGSDLIPEPPFFLPAFPSSEKIVLSILTRVLRMHTRHPTFPFRSAAHKPF
jgi:hypothetical protein